MMIKKLIKMKTSRYFYADIIIMLTLFSSVIIEKEFFYYTLDIISILYILIVLIDLVMNRLRFSIPKFPSVIVELFVLIGFFSILLDVIEEKKLIISSFILVFLVKIFLVEKKNTLKNS